MTSTYLATIEHHSISRARSITVTGTLTDAKRAASREFQGEFLDYVIAIYHAPADDDFYPAGPEDLAASKRVGARRWSHPDVY